jgi:hypothetical protein
MTPLRATLVIATLAAACCGGMLACLDLTPIVYEVAGADSSVPPVDASVDTTMVPTDARTDGDAMAFVDVFKPPTCVQCLATPGDASPPGCADTLNACLADTKCAATYQCALRNGCFQQPSFRDIVNCGLPCANAAGITGLNDPALTLIYNVATCAENDCNGPCALGDAGLGLD